MSELRIAELEAEAARVQAKLWASSDQDIVDALKLKLDALQTELQSLKTDIERAKAAEAQAEQSRQAEQAAQQESANPTAKSFREFTPAEKDAYERLYRIAKAELTAGKKEGAKARLVELRRMVSDHPEVDEFEGDIHLAEGNSESAISLYRKALEVNPANYALERKLGEVVLRVKSGLTIDDQMRAQLSDSPFLSESDIQAGATPALVYTLFLPGMGHITLARTKKGLTLLTIWLIAVFMVFLLREDLANMIGAGRAPGPTEGGRPIDTSGAEQVLFSIRTGTAFVLLPLFTAIITHLVALIEIAQMASTKPKRKIEVERPKPPVDLPFE